MEKSKIECRCSEDLGFLKIFIGCKWKLVKSNCPSVLFSLAQDSADFDDSFGDQIREDSDLEIETTSSPVTTISTTTETNSSQNLTSQEVEALINQLEELKEQFINQNSVKVIEGEVSIMCTAYTAVFRLTADSYQLFKVSTPN